MIEPRPPEVEMDISTINLKTMYVTMQKIRKFEEKVAELVSLKEIITPCHLYIGQEAIAVGVSAALNKEDYAFSTHRSHGHYIAKGGDIRALMAELYCRETGCSKGMGGSMHVISSTIGLPGSSAIVAGTIPLAIGAALAFSIRRDYKVSVAFFGDGATNEGVFYESLNFASLKKLPVIFICENNLYSTHMPISACLANSEIYKIADAFNIPGIRIDGNNVINVFSAAKKAIENARMGKGPTLIECMTYRWKGHVGPDDDLDKGLRNKQELVYWMNRCPIKMLEEVLFDKQILSNSRKKEICKDIKREINEAINFAKASPHPAFCRDDVLKSVFTGYV